jgi:glycine reductase
MSKLIEKTGLTCVHVCTIIPISQFVGANRIVRAISIPHPLGDPNLDPEEEFSLRKSLVLKALKALETPIDEQTVF